MMTLRCMIVWLGLLGCLQTAFSQEKGTITGKVSDETDLLPGANVIIKGTSFGSVTDFNGRFRLSQVPYGEITISFIYIGYETVYKTVILNSPNLDLGTIVLSEADNQLGEVVLSGSMAPSQQKAMMIKKTSLPIMDVLASDAIGKLPDRNAAEAVQRLPGVSVNRYHGEANQVSVRGTPYAWSSTLYNGTRLPSANVFGSRNALLDAIPSEMIQYVQLSKSITPDMEGDAIGGSVNFITRSAPDKRMLNISLAGGYNERSQNGTYNTSVIYGDRFFDKKLGVVISGSIWERNWAADEMAIDYNLNREMTSERYSINTVNAKRYIGTRRTTALNAAIEYEFNENNKLFARLVRDQFDDIRPVLETYYEFNRNRYRFSTRYSDYQTNLNGAELGGIHQLFPKLKMDWTVSHYDMYYRLETPPYMPSDQKGLPIAQFFQRLEGDFGVRSNDGLVYNDFDSPDGNGVNPRFIQPALTNPNDILDPARLRLEQLIIYQIDQREQDNVGQTNFTYEENDQLTFKAGVKLRNKELRGMFTPLVFLPNALLGIPGSQPMRFLNEFETVPYPIAGGLFNELNNPFDNLIVDPLSNDQLFSIFSPEFLQANDFGDYSSPSNVTTKYNGSENVYASYVMGVYKPQENIIITGGVRNEYTDITMNSGTYDAETGETGTIKRKHHYNAFLPMVNFKYRLHENFNLRAAYTRTFARANFQDLNPGENIDITTGFPRITRGNTALKPTFSNNYDLMAEYFMSNIGLFTAGIFYKDISDLIFRDLSQQTINGVNYLVSQPNNLENSYLIGFETGITRRFSELPGFLSGFGVDANYTYIHSETRVPRRIDEGVVVTDITSLPNQSRNLFNASVFYEKGGLTLRLAGNYRGKAIETINQDLGPDFYVWTGKNFTVDFSGAYAITEKLRAFVEIRNLTNEPFVQYLGNDRRRLTSSEWFSISGQAGLRYSFF